MTPDEPQPCSSATRSPCPSISCPPRGACSGWRRAYDSTAAGRDSLRRALAGEPPPPVFPLLHAMDLGLERLTVRVGTSLAVAIWARIYPAADSAWRVATNRELLAAAGSLAWETADPAMATAVSQRASSTRGTVTAHAAGATTVRICAPATTMQSRVCSWAVPLTVAP